MKKISQQERAIKIERYILKNKFFFMICIIVIVLLAVTALKDNNTDKSAESDIVLSENAETDNSNSDSAILSDGLFTENSKILKWKFYPIDAWILGIGAGFCTVMIIRERKKAKEDFN